MQKLFQTPATWLALTVLPVLGIILFMYFYLFPHTNLEFGTAMPIAVGCSAIGGAFYYFFLKKGVPTKQLAYLGEWVVLGIVGLVLVMVFAKADSSQLMTCPVCGYKTLSIAGESCEVCKVSLSEEKMKAEGYTNRAEFIKGATLIFFLPESGEKVDFWGERPEAKGFLKDSLWKPAATAQEVLEILRMSKDSAY